VFAFFERMTRMLLPVARPLDDQGAFVETQRRALLAIREVLLEERATVTPDHAQSHQRSSVIDAILAVLDRELGHLSPLDTFVQPESNKAQSQGA